MKTRRPGTDRGPDALQTSGRHSRRRDAAAAGAAIHGPRRPRLAGILRPALGVACGDLPRRSRPTSAAAPARNAPDADSAPAAAHPDRAGPAAEAHDRPERAALAADVARPPLRMCKPGQLTRGRGIPENGHMAHRQRQGPAWMAEEDIQRPIRSTPASGPHRHSRAGFEAEERAAAGAGDQQRIRRLRSARD